jgi:hypothetical protein
VPTEWIFEVMTDELLESILSSAMTLAAEDVLFLLEGLAEWLERGDELESRLGDCPVVLSVLEELENSPAEAVAEYASALLGLIARGEDSLE